jgi:hypothetical protein
MTSLAFILGVVPLVRAEGAAALSRQSLGTAVFGGMIAATVLAIFFIPTFFVVMQKLIELRNGPPTPPPADADHAEAVAEAAADTAVVASAVAANGPAATSTTPEGHTHANGHALPEVAEASGGSAPSITSEAK